MTTSSCEIVRLLRTRKETHKIGKPLARISAVAALVAGLPGEAVEAIEPGQVESVWLAEQRAAGREGMECHRIGVLCKERD